MLSEKLIKYTSHYPRKRSWHKRTPDEKCINTTTSVTYKMQFNNCNNKYNSWFAGPKQVSCFLSRIEFPWFVVFFPDDRAVSWCLKKIFRYRYVKFGDVKIVYFRRKYESNPYKNVSKTQCTSKLRHRTLTAWTLSYRSLPEYFFEDRIWGGRKVCGLNGAIFLVSMDYRSKSPRLNKKLSFLLYILAWPECLATLDPTKNHSVRLAWHCLDSLEHVSEPRTLASRVEGL